MLWQRTADSDFRSFYTGRYSLHNILFSIKGWHVVYEGVACLLILLRRRHASKIACVMNAMLTGVGEAVVCDFVAQAIVKSITVIKAIADNGQHFRDDRNRLHLRLKCEISRMERFEKIIKDPRIARYVSRDEEHTYYHIIREMNCEIIKYARKTKACTEQEIDENKFDSVLESLQEMEYPALEDPAPEQVSYWNRMVEKVSWAISKKKNIEKLVMNIEEWGNEFDKLLSSTVPLIVVEQHYTGEEIVEIAREATEQLGVSATCNILLEQQTVEAELGLDDAEVELRSINTPERAESLHVTGDDVILEFNGRVQEMFTGDEMDRRRTDLGGQARRCWASYRGAKVIVEFKDRLPKPPHTATRITRRLNSLVRELRLASATKTFLVLDCEGFYQQGQGYRIVYKLPQSFDDRQGQCQSLANILLKKEYSDILQQNLQHRLDLAKAMATTVFHLHTVRWVHKAINPDNILLFGNEAKDGTVAFAWDKPYLVGFEASRASLSDTDGVAPYQKWEYLAYIAPEYQNASEETHEPFQKLFDLYSLGVILLEIGLMCCFKASKYRTSKEWSNISLDALKQKYIGLAKDLKRDLGPLYSEAVVTCLTGEFDVKQKEEDQDETHLLAAFRSQVCEKLDQIRVSRIAVEGRGIEATY